ncbi:MAG TPA: hypothetical protein VII11_10990 [Bacteroidota bacterium]
MRKLVCVILASALLFGGCMTHIHVIGEGARSSRIVETDRQWYVLWGLVPINKVDTQEMAKGAKDYTIKTEITPLDFIISFVTSVVSVNCRSVEVKQ